MTVLRERTRALRSSRLSVLFLTLYPERMPSSRLRVYQYLPYLAGYGIDAQVLPALPEPWFSFLYYSPSKLFHLAQYAAEFFHHRRRMLQARQADLIVVQKGILSTNWLGLDGALKGLGVPLIFDFDDDVLGKNIVEFQNPFIRHFQDARQTLKLAAQASAVIAGNSYLKEQARQYNPNVFMVPTPVDTVRFCPFPQSPTRRNKETVLGWIGMEISLGNLRALAPVLEKLAKRYPVRLKIISRVGTGEKFQMPGVPVDFVDWNYQNEIAEMSDFDIGLMPLLENEWTKGKCGLKLLQYMAMEIPAVGSRTGANCEIVEDGVDGYLAAGEREWLDRLSILIESPELRKNLGSAARRKVERDYSLAAMVPRFVGILKETKQGAALPLLSVRQRTDPPSLWRKKSGEGIRTRYLRIAYLLPQLDPGGSEMHVIRLAEGLIRNGHQAEIFCIFAEGKLGELARQKGIPLHVLGAAQGWMPGILFRIFKALRAHPLDILHTYLFGFHFFGGLPSRLAKIPVIISSRRDVDLSQKHKVLWLEKMGNRFVDKVVCCSKAVERWAVERERLCLRRAATIYNGVDLNEFNENISGAKIRREFQIPEGDTVIGTVANFSLKKGYAYLLEAAESVLLQFPKAWFLWVGFGPLQAEMKRRAAASPCGKRIIFAGLRRDIPELLAAMDLFVFASLWEGLPNVILEAMAMGKPVISTAVGGVPEVLESGQEGILVPPKDPEIFARLIAELLKNPEEAGRMGRNAQKKIYEKFTLDQMIQEYENFYRNLLREKKGLFQDLVSEKKLEPLMAS